MTMTIQAAKNVLEQLDNATASEVASKTASAMLRGARGNSGVILSLLFKGFAKGFEGLDEINGEDIARSLKIGVEDAYKAVMKPTEGTMLTVARLAAEAAQAACAINNDAKEVWSAVCVASREALLLTPELLPVLKKAGVVDAGGRGVCEIFDGMFTVISGGDVINAVDNGIDDDEDTDEFRSAAAEFDDDITYTYCTEFIVGRASGIEKSPELLRTVLGDIGDCVVVVSDDEIIKVHVHTENPGMALQNGLEYGQLLTVKVENMKEQHKNAGNNKKPKPKKEQLNFVQPEEEVGFVAVGSGDGIVGLFKDLGCLHVVSGGQTMNPSTEDICKAILATPAKNVFVLPNNKNIILAAEQAIPLVTDRRVIIIPSKTIPQGLSAMLAFDADMSVEDNKEAMIEYMKGVSTGQVTFAARDSEFGGNKIKKDDIIALNNGKLTIIDTDPVKAVVKLVKSMVNKDTSYITLIYGEGITDEQGETAAKAISEKYGSKIDVATVNGGQSVYYFIVSIE